MDGVLSVGLLGDGFVMCMDGGWTMLFFSLSLLMWVDDILLCLSVLAKLLYLLKSTH